jgi:hypothetical protein
MSRSSKDNKKIKEVIPSDDSSDNNSDNSDQSDTDAQSDTEEPIQTKVADINKTKVSENDKTKVSENDKTKKNPTKRKSKKEHVKSLNEKIESIIDKEKIIKDEILELKKLITIKEKEREKYSDEKDKIIEILKAKTSSKESKSDDSKETKKVSTGFAKPVPVPKVLQTYLKLNNDCKDLSMTEVTSLLSNKLIEDKQKEDKLYIFNEKTLKELKLNIDLIKTNISEKALQHIEFNDNNIKVPYIYLKSLLKLFYN